MAKNRKIQCKVSIEPLFKRILDTEGISIAEAIESFLTQRYGEEGIKEFMEEFNKDDSILIEGMTINVKAFLENIKMWELNFLKGFFIANKNKKQNTYYDLYKEFVRKYRTAGIGRQEVSIPEYRTSKAAIKVLQNQIEEGDEK